MVLQTKVTTIKGKQGFDNFRSILFTQLVCRGGRVVVPVHLANKSYDDYNDSELMRIMMIIMRVVCVCL